MAKHAYNEDTIIGAIDAGSNAIRATVARVSTSGEIEVLARKREAVRLGHQVFTQGHIPPTRIAEAEAAFQKFRRLFAQHQICDYRAVATSAVRNANNQRSLLRKVKKTSKIRLEPISGAEEASLVRGAVLAAFPSRRAPRLIADLGGGSLELSLLDTEGQVIDSTCLPIGTVRLMEDRGLGGRIRGSDYRELRRDIRAGLEAWRHSPEIGGEIALCGGNARAWAKIVPGAQRHGLATLDARQLKEELRDLRRMTIEERVEVYDVRTDRAEVMAIAGVVFRCLAAWLGAGRFVVPDVGLLDGLLLHMAAERDELRLTA